MSARTVCVNDTDGDGDCAACARNPEAGCRLPAREAIHRLFESGRTSYRLDAYLDAFAHELAEEIRQETAALKAAGVLEPDKFRPCRDAADQIDPHVATPGREPGSTV